MKAKSCLLIFLLLTFGEPMVLNSNEKNTVQPDNERELFMYPHFLDPWTMMMMNPYMSMMMMAPYYMGIMNPMLLGAANPYLMGMFNPYGTAMAGDMMRAGPVEVKTKKAEKPKDDKPDDTVEEVDEDDERKLVEIKQRPSRKIRLKSKIFNEDLDKLNDELSRLISSN